MATIKKYMDELALSALVDKIKAEDDAHLVEAKGYADSLASNYDAAGSAAGAETHAKEYTDALANGQVKINKEDIATLKGDGEGSVKKAIADAKALIDADIDAVEDKADKNAEDIAAINNVETGILKQAEDYTDAEVAKVQGEVDALETYVGAIPSTATAKDIVGYVQEKTSGIATDTALAELTGRVGTAETDIDAVEVRMNSAEERLEAVENKASANETAIGAEKSRAEGIEAGLESRLAAVEGDYLKGADKTELQSNIDAVAGAVELLTNGVDAEKVDGVNDLIKYVDEHGAEVTGIKEDIAENAEAISGVAGRMTTAEGKISGLETAVSTKVEQSAFDGAVEALQGADTGLSNRIATLEGKFGGDDGSVEDMISDAKDAAIAKAAEDAAKLDEVVLESAKGYTDAEIDKVEEAIAGLTEESAKHAMASDLTALDGRVVIVEGKVSTLEGKMTAVESKAAANEQAISTLNGTVATKAAQADLEAAVERIAQNETDIEALEGAVATKVETEAFNAAVERIAANETAIAANKSAIESFVAITVEEVNGLFA